MVSRGVSRFPRQPPLFPLRTLKRLSVTHFPTVYDLMSIFSTVFVFVFLENDKRNGNLHGHIVKVNEAHQQIRREDPVEVPLEEQIMTVNEGRPKRNDIVSQCLPVAFYTVKFSRLHYKIVWYVRQVCARHVTNMRKKTHDSSQNHLDHWLGLCEDHIIFSPKTIFAIFTRLERCILRWPNTVFKCLYLIYHYF